MPTPQKLPDFLFEPNLSAKNVSSYFFWKIPCAMYISGPFQERRAISRTRTHTFAKSIRRVLNHKRKSNFWLHVYTPLNCMFDKDTCYCYKNGYQWWSNWSYVNKYFGSESYWFYTEIKNVFFSDQFTSN